MTLPHTLSAQEDCALDLLRAGEVIGLPTETVYGLAGDATNALAIAKIYARKNRPEFNPLIVHGYSLDQLKEYAVFSKNAEKLAVHFWPGPLTLVLPRTKNCPADFLVSAGMNTIALRIPRHEVALRLLRSYGKPLAAPSANISNHLSPTTAIMVRSYFPDLHVLEGGSCAVGLESTIIGCGVGENEGRGNDGEMLTLLRPGGIAVEDIEALVGPLARHQTGHILAPGMLKKHYAPRTPLRLDALSLRENELFLGFGNHCKECTLNLSEKGDLVEAASHLFSMLHMLDTQAVLQGCASIAVAPIPLHGLGLAINDRLNRAVG